MSRIDFLEKYATEDKHYNRNDEIERVIKSPNYHDVVHAIRYEYIPESRLKEVYERHADDPAKDIDYGYKIRSEIAHRSRRPENIELAVNDSDPHVRAMSAVNPQITRDQLDRLSNDSDDSVLLNVTNATNTTPDQLKNILHSKNASWHTMRNALTHKLANTEHFDIARKIDPELASNALTYRKLNRID